MEGFEFSAGNMMTDLECEQYATAFVDDYTFKRLLFRNRQYF